ncbi:amidohydrolase family protein (plasmid) [Comamonadaceae bacterium OTU4NAUVB1]|nr:amidohydrolase family protein [Comamonadaceae bacterium OTU4NAUVB1]
MNRIVFRNARLFDGLQRGLQPASTIVVEDGLIAAVAPGDLPVDDALSFDLAGRTLMPGLIDAHVHVTATIPDFFKLSMLPQSLVTAQAKDVLAGMLDRGFTTVRDAGGADAGLVQAVEQGLFAGPRLFIAGRALTQTGGHGDTRPAFFQNVGCACCGAVGILGHIADGVGAVRRAAREELRNGAHQIKVMAGGGISSPNDPLEGTQYSIEELTAIVQEATAARTYVMAHAYSPEAIVRAVRCGVRSIEHGNLLDEASARLMAEAGTFLVPTLATYAAIAANADRLGWSQAMREKTDRVKHQGVEALRIARAAGVRIALGTDLLGDMHASQSDEFMLRLPAMPADEIVWSATAVNADLLGQTGRLGCVAPGAHADLLVIDGDPLADVRLLQQPGRMPVVMKQGRMHRCTLAPDA